MSILSNYLSIKYAYSLARFSKSIPKYIKILDSEYRGLAHDKIPLKIIKGNKELRRVMILYPGASPHAENHPSMIFLAAVLANIGFDVYIPRIPPLKDLDISENNIDWFKKAYKEIIKRNDVKGSLVTCMGVSYGGALLLKSSLSGPMQENSPHCIITYGTIFDVQTSLDFVLSGELTIKDKKVKIKPNEWGMVVCFHNFLSKIDIGYDSCFIQKIMQLRVQDNNKDLQNELNKLDKDQLCLVSDILNGKISSEVKRIIDIILREKIDLLDSLSPKHWCEDIKTKVFIMHGASDDMVPYTQSILLSQKIKNSELFISYLYEHNEISPKKSMVYKLKESIRLIRFIDLLLRYHEN